MWKCLKEQLHKVGMTCRVEKCVEVLVVRHGAFMFVGVCEKGALPWVVGCVAALLLRKI